MCKKECNPYQRPTLDGVNTEAAEQTFFSVGHHKHSVKHMRKEVFNFFGRRFADLYNRYKLRKQDVPELAVNDPRPYTMRGTYAATNPAADTQPSVELDPGDTSVRFNLEALKEAFDDKESEPSKLIKQAKSTPAQRLEMRRKLRAWALKHAVATNVPDYKGQQPAFHGMDAGGLYWGARTGPQGSGVGSAQDMGGKYGPKLEATRRPFMF